MKIQTKLPITAKLIPRPRNLLYLFEVAAVTRFAIGGLRVLQNSPDKYQSNNLTEFEKRKSFLERIFIEIFGTGGYMVVLHLAQDLMSKWYEAQHSYKPPQMETPLSEMTRVQKEKVNKVIIDVFGDPGRKNVLSAEGIISRVLYGSQKEIPLVDGKGAPLINKKTGRQVTSFVTEKATLSTLREKLADVLDTNTLQKLEKEFIKPTVEPYVRKLYRASSISVLAGVLGSAVFGGLIIQWINDNIFSPVIAPALIRLFYGEKDTALGRENDPNFQQAPAHAGGASTKTPAQLGGAPVRHNPFPASLPISTGQPPLNPSANNPANPYGRPPA